MMTPRPKMVWLNADDSPEENRRLIAESRHSYYPVARGDLDDLLGVASIKDAPGPRDPGRTAHRPAGIIAAPPLLPEGAPATETLAAFKRSSLPRALEVAERGHIEGLRTSADVLEPSSATSKRYTRRRSCAAGTAPGWWTD